MNNFTITIQLDDIAVPTGYVMFDMGSAPDEVNIAIQVNRNAPDEVLAHEIHHAVKLARLFSGDRSRVDMDTLHLLEREADRWAKTLSAS